MSQDSRGVLFFLEAEAGYDNFFTGLFFPGGGYNPALTVELKVPRIYEYHRIAILPF